MSVSAKTTPFERTLAPLPLTLAGLLFVDGMLVALHMVGHHYGDIPEFFYLDAESNLPTWWSSTQLLLAGLALAAVTLRAWMAEPGGRWLGLFVLTLLAMSVDEMAMMHEKAGRILDLVVDRSDTVFHHSGLWFAVIGLPFFVFVLLVLWKVQRFLQDVPGGARRLLLGMGVLLLGALGMEALSNFVVSPEEMSVRSELGKYVVLVALEEGFEMIGGSIMLWAALDILARHSVSRGLAEEVRPLPPRHRHKHPFS